LGIKGDKRPIITPDFALQRPRGPGKALTKVPATETTGERPGSKGVCLAPRTVLRTGSGEHGDPAKLFETRSFVGSRPVNPRTRIIRPPERDSSAIFQKSPPFFSPMWAKAGRKSSFSGYFFGFASAMNLKNGAFLNFFGSNKKAQKPQQPF
jgi:hypothetical protein